MGKLLERLPESEAGLAWKPHAKSMSLGGICTHLANLPTWTGEIFDRAQLPDSYELECVSKGAGVRVAANGRPLGRAGDLARVLRSAFRRAPEWAVRGQAPGAFEAPHRIRSFHQFDDPNPRSGFGLRCDAASLRQASGTLSTTRRT